jgi:hypothetical protein
VANVSMSTEKTITITLDPPGSLQGLIDQFLVIRDKVGVGGTAAIKTINGAGMDFKLTLIRPD